MDKEGPIRRVARIRHLKYKDIAEATSLSVDFVRQLASGQYQPGRMASDKILAEYGDLVTREELQTWRPE